MLRPSTPSGHYGLILSVILRMIFSENREANFPDHALKLNREARLAAVLLGIATDLAHIGQAEFRR